MIKECKIVMPFYKIAYAVFFVIILSLVRGVSVSHEVGIALEPPMAILAAAFCADTYAMEIVSRRSEVWRLYPMKRRIRAICMRMMIQEVFLLLLAAAGYGLFFLFQKPRLSDMMSMGSGGEVRQFLVFLVSISVTLAFWGILSNTIACIFRSMWLGIGGSLLLWIFTHSTLGENYLGKWNAFSYTFRNIESSDDLSWLAGKCICTVFCIAMVVTLPDILRKRG